MARSKQTAVYSTQTNQTPLSKQSDTEINFSQKNRFIDWADNTTKRNNFSFSEPEGNIWRHLNVSEFEHCASNYKHLDLLKENLAVRSGSIKATFYNTFLRKIKKLF